MADSMPAANDAVDVPLFPDYGPPTPEAEPQLSADRRRTLRQQAQYVANGVHPLTRGPLHPLASRHRDADSPKSDPFTCGSCYFREVLRWHARSYAKCVLPNPLSGADAPADRIYSRVTHSAASDVRAWWPACRDYSPGDRISPDAARCVPEVDA